MRAVVSAPPAGGYGTITWMVRVGHAACAVAVRMKEVAAKPASKVRRESLFVSIADPRILLGGLFDTDCRPQGSNDQDGGSSAKGSSTGTPSGAKCLAFRDRIVNAC